MISTCCYRNRMFAYNVLMKIFLFSWQGLLIPIFSSSCFSSCSKGFSTMWSQLVAIRTLCANNANNVCMKIFLLLARAVDTNFIINCLQFMFKRFFNTMVSTYCYQNWMFAHNICMKIFRLFFIPIYSSSSYSFLLFKSFMDDP